MESLYNYAFDNPLRFIDPDGMSPTGYSGYEQETTGFYGARDGVDEMMGKADEDKQREENKDKLRSAIVRGLYPKEDEQRQAATEKAQQDGAMKVFKSYFQALPYIRENSANGLVLDDGRVVIIPDDGYIYKRNKRTDQYWRSSSDGYDLDLKIELLPNRMKHSQLQIHIDGNWIGAHDLVIGLSEPYIDTRQPDHQRSFIYPFLAARDHYGLDLLIAVYPAPWNKSVETWPNK